VNEEKDHIDDIFKERSEQQSFDIPDSFLEDINKKLDTLERKKRRGGFWWLFLIPALVVGGFFLWPDRNEEINTQQSKTQLTNETKKSGDNKDQENHSGIDSNKIYEENGSVDSSINGQEEQLNPSLSSPVISGANRGSNTATSARNVEEALENTENTGELSGTLNEQEASTNTTQTENRESTENNELGQNTSNEENTHGNIENEANTDEVSTNTDTEDITIAESTENSRISQNDTVLEGDETNQTLESDTIAKEIEEKDIASADSTLKVDSTNSVPIKNNSNERSHEIQVFGSLMVSYSKLSLAGVPDEFSMSQMENPLRTSPQFGVAYNFNFNNYTVGTGLLYQQSGESVNYETNTIEVQDSVYVSGFYFDTIFNPNTQNWDTIQVPIYDTIGVDISIGQSYSGKNRYNWISIPLHFGYRMHLGDFTVVPRLGASFDFGIGKNNGIYAELINQGLIEHQANRVILSYSLQCEIRRNFERFHVFVNPYFRSNITPVISSQVQTRKYNSWGVNAGIGISL
jgi:hypothetical protein